MHEAGLHIHAQQHAKPDGVDAQLDCHGAQHWQDDEGDLKKVQEERQEENEDVDDDQKAGLTARQTSQQMLNPFGTVHALEDH